MPKIRQTEHLIHPPSLQGDSDNLNQLQEALDKCC